MAGNNSGGPWGGGGNQGGGNRGGGGDGGDGRGPGKGPQIPEIEEIVKKGQEQLKVLMGGRGGRGGGSGGGAGPSFGRGAIGLVVVAVVLLWGWASFYTVKPEEKSVELLFGKEYGVRGPGLHFAPWPAVTKEIVKVTGERIVDIGVGRGSSRTDNGLMLTGDENIVDIDFQVVWNIENPSKFLFNIAGPQETIAAVAESAMREIVARSKLAPILNKDRGAISAELAKLLQKTLDSYDSGINIVRINLDKADPPAEVIDSFRKVQAAEQTRDTLKKRADAYANKVVAGARGESAQLQQEAEGYRAQVVNQAEGEASRFNSVYAEYVKAPEVTRKRIYIETMEKVLGDNTKIIIDDNGKDGSGVVSYLPLNELIKKGATQ